MLGQYGTGRRHRHSWSSLAGSQGGQGHGLGRYREVNATELREEAWLASEMRVWKGPAWRKPWWDGKGGGPEPKPGLRAGEGLRLGVQGLGASKSQHSRRGRVGWKTASHRVRYRHEKPGRFRCCAFFSMPVCSLAWVQFWELPPSGFHRGRCRTLCPPGSQPSQGSPLPLVRDTECLPRPRKVRPLSSSWPSPPLLPLSLPLTHSAPATWASSLFRELTSYAPATGPLHVLFLLPVSLFRQLLTASAPYLE